MPVFSVARPAPRQLQKMCGGDLRGSDNADTAYQLTIGIHLTDSTIYARTAKAQGTKNACHQLVRCGGARMRPGRGRAQRAFISHWWQYCLECCQRHKFVLDTEHVLPDYQILARDPGVYLQTRR